MNLGRGIVEMQSYICNRCRYTVGLRLHHARERGRRRIVNLFETLSHSYYPSSPIGAIVLLRTISSRKITNSLFQDSLILPLSLTWCNHKPTVYICLVFHNKMCDCQRNSVLLKCPRKNYSSDIYLQLHEHVYTNYSDFKCP